jgi:DNA-directed RNA polymerase subunit RPC12/RpoP
MVNCTMCDKEIDRLEAYGNGECLDCHAKNFVMPTAEELVAMWSGR